MSLFGTGRREGLLAVLILLLLSVLLHLPGLFLGKVRTPLPKTSHGSQRSEATVNRDSLLPTMQSAGRTIRAGELPLWNREARFGEPFLTSTASLYYPPFWLLMLSGGATMLELLLCLHSFLACLCMYRFLRNLPLSRYVSFLGGALYGLGWFMTVQLDRLPHAAAAALIPLALEMSWRVAVHRRRRYYAVALAMTVALLFATGGTGTAFLGLFLSLALFLLGQLALDREERLCSLKSALVAAGLLLLFTSPLLVSYLVHLGAHPPPPGPTVRHLEVPGLISALSPTAMGGIDGQAPEALRSLSPGADPMELALFPGSLVLFLVFLGLVRPKRTSHGLFWVMVGGFGLLVSLDSPLAEHLGQAAFWGPSSPGLALVLVNIAFVVLAAVALESFFEAPLARRYAVPLASGIVLFLAALVFTAGFLQPDLGRQAVGALIGSVVQSEIQAPFHHLRLALLQPLLFCAVIAALFLFWRRMGILRFKTSLATLVLLDLLLVGHLATPRSETKTNPPQVIAQVPAGSGRLMLAGRRPRFPTPALMSTGLPSFSTSSDRILARTQEYLSVVDASMVQVRSRVHIAPLLGAPLLADPLLEVAAVGVGISSSPCLVEGFTALLAQPLAESRDSDPLGPLQIHVRMTGAVRARVLYSEFLVDSRKKAVLALRQHATRLDQTVILENRPKDFSCKRPAVPAKLQMLRDGANEVRLQVDMGQGRGYLLLADAHAPGWGATVDGVRASILPANLAMRAIPLSEGKHDVVFSYSPACKWLGMFLAVLGVFLAGFWMFWSWQRRRSPIPAARR